MTAQKPDCTGSGVYLAHMVTAFARAGHEQAVVCGIGRDESFEMPEGVGMFAVRFETPEVPFPVCGMSDVMPYKATRYRDLTPEMGAQFEAAFTRVVDEAIRDFAPDLVICNHLYFVTTIVRERVVDVPVVAICHATCLRQLQTNPFQAERILATIPKFDHVFALHDVQRRTIIDMFGIAEHLVDVIGTGYDAETFVPAPETTRSVGPKRVVYAGKISFAKGVASLMRALPRMEADAGSIEVRCVGGWGDQGEYDEIRRLATLSPYPVHFLGRIPSEELVKEYQAADTFILPSYYEGLPLVTIEALACGCKVVCCDWPGVRPWMEERLECAPIRYVELGDPAALSEGDQQALDAFEGRLARALDATLQDEPASCDMSDLTWDALVARLMGFLGLEL